MKSSLLSRLCSWVIILFLAGTLSAQEITTLPEIKITSSTNVNEKVSKAFQNAFKDAQNATWYKLNKNYLVEFINADMKNRALYQKNGYLIYHISYGGEKNLPDEVRKELKSNYVDFNITNAINVKQDNRDIWVVNLEDNKKLLVVKVENGELEEVNNLEKTI